MANRSSHHSSHTSSHHGSSHTSSHHGNSHISSHHSGSHHTSSHGGSFTESLIEAVFDTPRRPNNYYNNHHNHHNPSPMNGFMPPPPPPQINNYYYNNSGNANNNHNANYNNYSNNTTTAAVNIIPATAVRCKSKENWQMYAVSGQTYEQYMTSDNFKGTWYDPHGTACNLDMQDPYIKENYKPIAQKEKISKIGGIAFFVSILIKICALPIIDFLGMFIESDAVFHFVDDFIWYSPWLFMIASLVMCYLPKNGIKKAKKELAANACQYYEGMYEMYGEDSRYNDVNMFGM